MGLRSTERWMGLLSQWMSCLNSLTTHLLLLRILQMDERCTNRAVVKFRRFQHQNLLFLAFSHRDRLVPAVSLRTVLERAAGLHTLPAGSP